MSTIGTVLSLHRGTIMGDLITGNSLAFLLGKLLGLGHVAINCFRTKAQRKFGSGDSVVLY